MIAFNSLYFLFDLAETRGSYHRG